MFSGSSGPTTSCAFNQDSEMTLHHWIRQRADNREPLNLHAVLEARPDLLDEAFAGPRPQGWRRSLFAAGVDPYRIEQQHEALVQCRICGEWRSVLGKHLSIGHGISRSEYLEEYGADCELSSEMFRAGKFRGGTDYEIAHWEKLWSRYYVLDWIILLHERGHDVNYVAVVHSFKSLAHYGIFFFGSWDEALRLSGLNPETIRRHPLHRKWSKPMIAASLRELADAKKSGARGEVPIDLTMAIRRYYTSTESACKAAGLKSDDVLLRPAVLSGDEAAPLVADLRELESLKGRERGQRLSAIYSKHRKYITSRYGSLQKLAIAEGLDPSWVAPRCYRTEADVLHDLGELAKEGRPLHFKTLKNGYRRLYNVILETGWGATRLTSATS
jgi:hypothetical protein